MAFACWGSFLNVLAYRLIHGGNIIWDRSACTHCKHTIAWYDLIPILSWIFLQGKCRYCKQSISILYPFIELLSVGAFFALYNTVHAHYFPAYFLFFSALIVTIRSDLETMLISRFVTIFLIPAGLLLSIIERLPITPAESLIGSIGGYLFLFGIAKLFYLITKKEGIGQGDFELLAFIGSFIGFLGCWFALCVGSIIGSLFGLGYMLITKSGKSAKIPFGPFLALGAIAYVLYQDQVLNLILQQTLAA